MNADAPIKAIDLVHLLRCPFCSKSEPLSVVPDGVFSYAVLCNYRKDGCGAMGPQRAQQFEAVTGWNNRVLQVAGPEEPKG